MPRDAVNSVTQECGNLARMFLVAAVLMARGVAARQPLQTTPDANPRFTCSIAPENDPVILEYPIRIKAILKNTSTQTVSMPENHQDWGNCRIKFLDNQGDPVPEKAREWMGPDGHMRRTIRTGSGHVVEITPGKTFVDFFQLDSEYEITLPGRYTVQASRYDDQTKTWVTSNTIALTVVTKEKAHVSFEIKDDSGAFIPNAKINYRGATEKIGHEAQSDQNGRAFADLEAGTYEITATGRGFQTQEQTLEIEDARSRTVSVALKVQTGSPIVPVQGIPLIAKIEPAFSITISTPTAVVMAGSEARINISVLNNSKKGILLARSLRDGEGEFSSNVKIVAERGQVAQGNPYSCEITGHENQLDDLKGRHLMYFVEPGKTLEDSLIANKLCDLSRPGKYSIQVTRSDLRYHSGLVESNTIRITVAP